MAGTSPAMTSHMPRLQTDMLQAPLKYIVVRYIRTAIDSKKMAPGCPAVLCQRGALLHRTHSAGTQRLADFTTDRRVLILVAMAVCVGTGGVGAAWLLLRAIAL